jgi:hypothetical protein
MGRQIKRPRQPTELFGDENGLLSVDPPNDPVVRRESVRVFQRQLRLADTAQPVQRLHDQRLLSRSKPSMHFIEHPGPAGEMRISGALLTDPWVLFGAVEGTRRYPA